jgi:hypothetical protein
MRAEIKKAFQDFRQCFNRSTMKDRHHLAATIVYMVRSYWRGAFHCRQIFTKFTGHAKTFTSLEEVRAFIDHWGLKHFSCPVHGHVLFNEKEREALKNILLLHDALKAAPLWQDAKTTDYCAKCGDSPQSAVHPFDHPWEPRLAEKNVFV